MGFLVSHHGQLGAIPPPPFLSISPLESMPVQRGISAILARYPKENKANGRDTPPLRYYLDRVLRDMGGISHGVAKFTRPFVLFAPFAGHPSSSPFLGTFSPFAPPRKVLCSVEQRAQRRAWRGRSGMDLSTKFGKEIPSRNLRKKRSASALLYQVMWSFLAKVAVRSCRWFLNLSDECWLPTFGQKHTIEFSSCFRPWVRQVTRFLWDWDCDLLTWAKESQRFPPLPPHVSHPQNPCD